MRIRGVRYHHCCLHCRHCRLGSLGSVGIRWYPLLAMQKWVPNDCEFRIYIVNGQVRHTIFSSWKTTDSYGLFRGEEVSREGVSVSGQFRAIPTDPSEK